MHRMNRERYAGDSKMHEMVAVAMEENWDVCQKHIDCLIGVTAEVIGDGVASGPALITTLLGHSITLGRFGA